jgi:hypothetical protein
VAAPVGSVKRQVPVVAVVVLLAVLSLHTAVGSFNRTYTDPAGDITVTGSPPVAVRNAADIISGTSSQSGGNLTLTLTAVGKMLPGNSISTYVLFAHGDQATVLVTVNETGDCLACSWTYDYTSSGGGVDFSLNVDYSFLGPTLTITLPIEWGGEETTYSLTFSSTVTASDVASSTAVDSGGDGNTAPTISNPPPATVTLDAGSLFTWDYDAEDAEGNPFVWAMASSPQATWLTMNPDSGVLAGTAPSAGTWTITVSVTDDPGAISLHTFTLSVGSCTGNRGPSITNAPSGPVTVDPLLPYEYTFAATDPEGDALEWDVTGGLGATIDEDSGELTYVPITSGSRTLSVTVQDTCGNAATASVTLVPDDGTTPIQPTIFGGLLLLLLLILIIVIVVVVLVVYFATRKRPGQPPAGGMPPQPGMPQQAPTYQPPPHPPRYQPPGPQGP